MTYGALTRSWSPRSAGGEPSRPQCPVGVRAGQNCHTRESPRWRLARRRGAAIIARMSRAMARTRSPGDEGDGPGDRYADDRAGHAPPAVAGGEPTVTAAKKRSA